MSGYDRRADDRRYEQRQQQQHAERIQQDNRLHDRRVEQRLLDQRREDQRSEIRQEEARRARRKSDERVQQRQREAWLTLSASSGEGTDESWLPTASDAEPQPLELAGPTQQRQGVSTGKLVGWVLGGLAMGAVAYLASRAEKSAKSDKE